MHAVPTVPNGEVILVWGQVLTPLLAVWPWLSYLSLTFLPWDIGIHGGLYYIR